MALDFKVRTMQILARSLKDLLIKNKEKTEDRQHTSLSHEIEVYQHLRPSSIFPAWTIFLPGDGEAFEAGG